MRYETPDYYIMSFPVPLGTNVEQVIDPVVIYVLGIVKVPVAIKSASA